MQLVDFRAFLVCDYYRGDYVREAQMKAALPCAIIAVGLSCAPAQAAIVFQRTDTLTQTFYSAFYNVIDPLNVLGPAFRAEELVGRPGGASEPNPNPTLPSTHRYQLTLVLPETPVAINAFQFSYFWFDQYVFFDGRWIANGGSDNIDNPTAMLLAPTIHGNVWTYEINDRVTFTDTFPSATDFRWTSNGLINATFPESAIGQTLSITVATIPEPSAWFLLICGFGLTGAAMRRRRSVDEGRLCSA